MEADGGLREENRSKFLCTSYLYSTGSGIAQLLLDKAEEFAWSRGENRIELTTSLAQFAAIKFYKRNGYIQAKYAREHDITFGFLPGIRRRLVIMHKECPAHLG